VDKFISILVKLSKRVAFSSNHCRGFASYFGKRKSSSLAILRSCWIRIGGGFFIGITRFVFHREALDAAGSAILFGFLLSILSYIASYAALLSRQDGSAAELHSRLLQTILATVTTSLAIFTVPYLVVGGRLLQKLYEWIGPLNLNPGLSVWLAMTAYGLAAIVLLGLITEWKKKIMVRRSLQLLIWCVFYIVICASVLKFGVVDPPLTIFQ
jgi:hypothetical protein